MSVLGTNYLSLSDKLNRENRDGSTAAIMEIMAECNEWARDALWLPCNDGSSHKTTMRTGIPQGTWVKLYGGIQPTKSTTSPVKDSCGMLHNMTKIAEDLVDLSKTPEALRLSEAEGVIEGLSQDVSDTFFYGDTDVYPERFLGLHARFNKLSTDKTKSGYQIIDAGGTGSDLTSIWFVAWGDRLVHMIYPETMLGGLQMIRGEKAELTAAPDGVGEFRAYVDYYKVNAGLCVRDWRAVSRVANIESAAATGADLFDLMIQAYHRWLGRRTPARYNVFKGENGSMTAFNKAIYVNETIMTALDRKARSETKSSTLTIKDIGGEEVISFRGVPIRRCDAILDTESQITA